MRLALIGKKLGHSFSPQLWSELFAKENIHGHFQLIETDNISSLKEIISTNNLCGTTVTIPYKQDAMAFLDNISPEATEIGAINCILKRGEKLFGYNTDIYGYEQLLFNSNSKSINPKSEGLNTLILGYGGAAKAVIYEHKKLKHNITIISRSANREVPRIAYNDIISLEQYDIIVNTTPLGMFPDIESYPNIPYNTIKKGAIAIDLVYNPIDTAFTKLCRKNGAATESGLLMLQKQAERFLQIINEPELG